ncbi:MAG: hypothetical protein ACPG4Y_00845 [Chitinophagales bacterium]
MVGEKFFLNISSLTHTELNSCIRFSRVDVFNKREEIIQTLELFKRNKIRFFSLLKDEKKLFFLLFPNEKKFIKKCLIDHFHYCMLFFEDFVIHNELQKNKEKRLEILEQFYAKKRIEKEFLAVNKKRIKIEKAKKTNIDSFLNLYLMHKSKFYFLLKEFDNEVFNEIDLAVNYLDKYYFFSKMNAFQELESNSLMNNVTYEHVFKDEIVEKIDFEAKNGNDVLFKIYRYTIALYNKDFDFERYLKLKKMVLDNIGNFEPELKKLVLSDLSNYVSYMYNKNADNKLIQESFEILKIQIKMKTLIDNNTFPDAAFSQNVRIALYLKEYEWAENFIETHKKYLKNTDLVLVSKADLLYNQAKYEELYSIVKNRANEKKIEGYNLRCIYAKALYDQQKFEELNIFLANFSTALRRKKENSENLLSSKIGFIQYLSRIVKYLNFNSKLKVLQKELSENKQVFHRNWLISKINILID